MHISNEDPEKIRRYLEWISEPLWQVPAWTGGSKSGAILMYCAYKFGRTYLVIRCCTFLGTFGLIVRLQFVQRM